MSFSSDKEVPKKESLLIDLTGDNNDSNMNNGEEVEAPLEDVDSEFRLVPYQLPEMLVHYQLPEISKQGGEKNVEEPEAGDASKRKLPAAATASPRDAKMARVLQQPNKDTYKLDSGSNVAAATMGVKEASCDDFTTKLLPPPAESFDGVEQSCQGNLGRDILVYAPNQLFARSMEREAVNLGLSATATENGDAVEETIGNPFGNDVSSISHQLGIHNDTNESNDMTDNKVGADRTAVKSFVSGLSPDQHSCDQLLKPLDSLAGSAKVSHSILVDNSSTKRSRFFTGARVFTGLGALGVVTFGALYLYDHRSKILQQIDELLLGFGPVSASFWETCFDQSQDM